MLDGTFWIISDPDKVTSSSGTGESSKDYEPHRVVTVTIEKNIRTPKDDFDVVEYDWKGVYKNDDDEVSYRRYDEPEELNVREYAASLGVDIDNLNMSLVDKTMFGSGMNLTKSTLDGLKQAGLMQEVTRQGDGSEWTTDENGEKVPFSSMGRAISKDEAQAANNPSDVKTLKTTIPFLDTDSPWHKAIPLDERKEFAKNATKVEEAKRKIEMEEKKKKLQQQRERDAVDPISTLTVARLRDILRERGLKVSGNKKELQDRLRAEVESMLHTNEGSVDDSSK
jgi:hypothetical protein